MQFHNVRKLLRNLFCLQHLNYIDFGLNLIASSIALNLFLQYQIIQNFLNIDSKKYVHWGGTTQNIVSNGDILILRKIHKIFLNNLSDLLKILSKLSLKTKNDLMAGRTHGQHALPITFGYKVACWIDEISRHIERIKESEPRVFKCIFGGAVGTSASFGKYGNKLVK